MAELKVRASITVGSDQIVLEPYSDNVYRIEINGGAEASYVAEDVPMLRAVQWLEANKEYTVEELAYLKRASNWEYADIDPFDSAEVR